MTAPRPSTSSFPAALLESLLLASLLLAYLGFASNYPYYFIWDMDHTASLDNLLIRSGFLPVHISLTSFGMYLLQTATSGIAAAAGWLSVENLADLETALNPLAAAAEHTAFLRLHSPFVSFAILVCLWASLVLYFQPGCPTRLLLLVALGTQESLFFHSALVRTELYSALYWSAGILVAFTGLGLARRTRRPAARRRLSRASAVGLGLFLGLAFVTKLQSLVCVVAAVLLFWLLVQHSKLADAFHLEAGPPLRRALLLAVANLASFGGLLLVALRTPIEGSFATFALSYGVNLLGYGVLAGGAVLVGRFVSGCLTRCPRAAAGGSGMALSLVFTGFLLSLLLHFVLYDDAATAWRYLVYDFKMLFARDVSFVALPGWEELLQRLASWLQHQPVPLLLTPVALTVLWLVEREADRPGWPRTRQLEIGLCGLALASPVFAARAILRDGIWVELPANLVTCVLLFRIGAVLSCRVGWRYLRRVPETALLLLLAANTSHAALIGRRLDANFNLYGWRDKLWLGSVYGGESLRYKRILDAAYGGRRRVLQHALRTAREHGPNRRMVEFAFPNAELTQREIGVLAEGFPIFVADHGPRLETVPDALEGALLVDVSGARRRRPLRYRMPSVREQGEDLDKVARAEPDRSTALTVLQRADLRVFVFLDANPEALAADCPLRPLSRALTVGGPGGRRQFRGFELQGSCALSLGDARAGRFFFAVLPRSGAAAVPAGTGHVARRLHADAPLR